MTDDIEFFLKMDTGLESDYTEPPFILHFSIPRDKVDEMRRHADAKIEGLMKHRPFVNASHAAQFTIANAIVANEHATPSVKELLSFLLVHMATDSDEKQATLAARAKKVGFVVAPSFESMFGVAASAEGSMNMNQIIKDLLAAGRSPFKFKFAALVPAA